MQGCDQILNKALSGADIIKPQVSSALDDEEPPPFALQLRSPYAFVRFDYGAPSPKDPLRDHELIAGQHRCKTVAPLTTRGGPPCAEERTMGPPCFRPPARSGTSDFCPWRMDVRLGRRSSNERTYVRVSTLAASPPGRHGDLVKMATVWVLTHVHADHSVCRVPSRRTPLPDWIYARRRALGHRIATLRREAGLSQDQLADRVGMERRSIQRYEGAIRDPRISDLLLIADALDVPIGELFT